MSESIAEYFNEEGIFAQHFKNYRKRDSQAELAQAIQNTIDQHSILVAEAGTGTGKTWAYLLPAFLSGSKVIISTGTKILQDQIYRKDIPAIRRMLDLPVQAVILKGRGNYVCRYYLERLEQDERPLHSRREAEQYQRIKFFSQQTSTGDKADCHQVDEAAPIWNRVTSTHENCLGKECPHVDECFVLKARKRAHEADIVVVNHALFMADYSLRQQGVSELLPEADVVIFDEAHQLPDVATQFMGTTVSTHQISEWLKDAELALRSLAADSRNLWESPLQDADQRLRELLLQCLFLEKAPGQRAAYESLAEPESLNHALKTFLKAMRQLLLVLQQLQERHMDLAAAARQGARHYEDLRDWLPPWILKAQVSTASTAAQEAAEQEEAVIHDLARTEDPLQPLIDEDGSKASEPPSDGPTRSAADAAGQAGAKAVSEPGANAYVRWLELSANQLHVRFSRAPLTVKQFGSFKGVEQSWVFTSATLSVNNNPQHFSHSLGLYSSDFQHWESPFDYRSNALLYVPEHLPLPSDPAFSNQFCKTLWPLIRVCRGGVLVLCTSLRAVEQAAESLNQLMRQDCAKRPELKRPILVQGHDTKAALMTAFRDSKNAVLVGSSAFWEGVNFPGDLLTLVAIDKLPFAPPDDPVLEARIRDCQERGGKPFFELQIPHAAIALKQGAGRLIRTEKDRGLLMIADRRLVEKSYGKLLWGGLPPFLRTRHFRNAYDFMQAVSASMDSDNADSSPP